MADKKQKRNDTVNPYDIQIGGSHYKKMKIQPSEFINKILHAVKNTIHKNIDPSWALHIEVTL